MEVLKLMYDHPWVTGVLLFIALEGTADIIKAFWGIKEETCHW
jgi:hypothetical protein